MAKEREDRMAIEARAAGVAADPVCAMSVNIAGAKNTYVFGGTTWYFCGKRCLDRFAADPRRYSGRNVVARTEPPPAPGVIYTCPMHPEVEQIGPGSCPKCGMALEPRAPTLEADDAELRRVGLRFWVCLALKIGRASCRERVYVLV